MTGFDNKIAGYLLVTLITKRLCFFANKIFNIIFISLKLVPTKLKNYIGNSCYIIVILHAYVNIGNIQIFRKLKCKLVIATNVEVKVSCKFQLLPPGNFRFWAITNMVAWIDYQLAFEHAFNTQVVSKY